MYLILDHEPSTKEGLVSEPIEMPSLSAESLCVGYGQRRIITD